MATFENQCNIWNFDGIFLGMQYNHETPHVYIFLIASKHFDRFKNKLKQNKHCCWASKENLYENSVLLTLIMDLSIDRLNAKIQDVCNELTKLTTREQELQKPTTDVDLVEMNNLLRRLRAERRNLNKKLNNNYKE